MKPSALARAGGGVGAGVGAGGVVAINMAASS
jgi:hypothetical protein